MESKKLDSTQLNILFIILSDCLLIYLFSILINMETYYRIVAAKAPINIAVIKYWGKSNQEYKIPINDSLSGTLSIDDMCATTSVQISNKFQHDELWLNGKRVDLSCDSQAILLLNEIRKLSNLEQRIIEYKVHIISHNNFPTAAGLASSAAGYACLAYVLGHAYGITDLTKLSIIARRGSGSACRSLFGGFVRWVKGESHETSKAIQIVDENHWPEVKVIICVINDKKKDTSSSEGMLNSVKTSSLLKYRCDKIVPERISAIQKAILDKDFETFANITMQDSNQFHAICLDTYPPIFYLNETSRQVIKICSIINLFYGSNKVAYTFDAGPNACIYLLNDFVPTFLNIIKYFFESDSATLQIQGSNPLVDSNLQHEINDSAKLIINELSSKGIEKMLNSINYLISTSIGSGPKLIPEEEVDQLLKNIN